MPGFSIHLPIAKVDSAKRLVYGVAALQEEDKSGETFHYDTSVPHFKTWSEEANKAAQQIGTRSLGNVREMHGKSAAGKLTQIEFNDDDKQIEVCAKVVDDAAWNKVEEGVYTGFSIGGDYVKRWSEGGTKFYTARPSEISLVDNPAMFGAHFSMIKADGGIEQRSFMKYVAPKENSVMITNDAVATRAEKLAKAANSTSFASFITAAREELEKEAASIYDGHAQSVALGGEGTKVVVDPVAVITDKNSVAQNEDTTHGTMADDPEFDKDLQGPKPSEPGNTAAVKVPSGVEVATDLKDMGKSADPRNDVQQGWQAKDGSFHISKADAVKHNAKLDSPLSALGKALGGLTAALGKDAAATADAPTAEKPAHTEKASGEAEDVHYADPGYKADKKKRYPVDTEKHVRAAWSYVHMPKNQKGYTPEQVSAVKSKIVAAWKSIIGGEPPEAASKSMVTGTLKKGMYSVSRLATIIEELDWLHDSIEREAEIEQDGSAVPAQLKGDIASLVGTLKMMMNEETAELFSVAEHVDFAEMMEMAATGIPGQQLVKYIGYVEGQTLEKSSGVGKGLSVLKSIAKEAVPKGNAVKIQAIHDHCCAMGAKCDDGNIGKGAGIVPDDNRLAKGMEILAAENEELRTGLTEAIDAINKMAEQVKAIQEQPVVQAPSRLSVVAKGSDVSGEATGGQPANELLKNFSPDALAAAAIRLTHSAGGHRVFNKT